MDPTAILIFALGVGTGACLTFILMAFLGHQRRQTAARARLSRWRRYNPKIVEQWANHEPTELDQ